MQKKLQAGCRKRNGGMGKVVGSAELIGQNAGLEPASQGGGRGGGNAFASPFTHKLIRFLCQSLALPSLKRCRGMLLLPHFLALLLIHLLHHSPCRR